MYWVYILQSDQSGLFYCGQTSDLEKRLNQHNDPLNRFTKTTSRYPGPWKLIAKFPCETRTEALRLERKIKKRGIKRYLEGLTGGC
jgi:putative endonuclease